MSDEPCMGVGVIYCTLRVNDHEAISVLIVSPTRRRESVLPGPRRTLPLSLRTCICRSSSAHTWLSSPLLENSGFLPLGDSSCVESVVVGARRFQIGIDAYCFHSDLHAMMPEASSHSSLARHLQLHHFNHSCTHQGDAIHLGFSQGTRRTL